MPRGEPVAAGERWVVVDALRAVALLGIVVVNTAFYHRGVGPSLAASGGAVGGEPSVLTVGLSALAEGRFYPLFSFLFGWGFAVQDDRARRRHGSATGPWLRRLAALFALGLAHGLLAFEGDILTTYAVVGVALLVVRPLRPAWLAALGAALLVVQALFTAALEALVAWIVLDEPGGRAAAAAETSAELARRADVHARGSFGEVVAERAAALAVDLPLGLLSVGGTVLGMMLLGLAAGRAGWVDPARWPAWLRGGAVPLWLVGLALSVPAAWLLGDGALAPVSPLAAAGNRLAYAVGGPVVALLWAAVVVRLADRAPGRALLRALAPAGRMSLTVYLAQSVVASLLFTGYGLGLGERMGIGGAVALMAGVWAAQVVLAALWFRAFAVGPLEGLTRAVAYLRPPTWRSRAGAAPSPPG